MTEKAMISCGLAKQFSRSTLGPSDLTVPKGAIYGFIGPNGAGKSTTFDLVKSICSQPLQSTADLI